MLEPIDRRTRDVAHDIVPHAASHLPTCNVLVTGKTGAGKSTLVNAVFGRDFAATGIGKPVTQIPRRYALGGVPVTVLDTRGLELGETDGRAGPVTQLIDRLALTPSDEQLHVAWYCIAAASARLDPGEETHLRALSRRLPIIVVVTQSVNDDADELAEKIREYNLPGVRSVVTVLAQARILAGVYLDPHGLPILMHATASALATDGLRMAFTNAQRASLPQKLRVANEYLRRRIEEPGGMIAKLASCWAYDVDRWSLRPVQAELMSLIEELALPFGMSVPRLACIAQQAERRERGLLSAVDFWIRHVDSDATFEIHARHAIAHYGDLYLELARQVAQADFDDEPMTEAAIRHQLHRLMRETGT